MRVSVRAALTAVLFTLNLTGVIMIPWILVFIPMFLPVIRRKEDTTPIE